MAAAKIEAAIKGLALETSSAGQVHCPAGSTVCRGNEQADSIVYDLVREVPSGLLTLVHQDSKAYGEGFDLGHRREAARSNVIWHADPKICTLCAPSAVRTPISGVRRVTE
jgi:hypothetical protein